MKTVGMLFVCLAGLGCGLHGKMRLHRRTVFLDRVSRWLIWSAEQIRYTAAPLSDVLRAAESSAEFSELPFLRGDTRGAVCELIRQHRTAMALTEEDARILCECVDGWGTADLDGEVSRLRRYGAVIEERCTAAREDAARRGRLFVTLGVCGGGAAALLLGG